MSELPHTMRRAGWRTGTFGECLSEFLGTLVLIAFGCGVVASAVAALNQSGRGSVAILRITLPLRSNVRSPWIRIRLA